MEQVAGGFSFFGIHIFGGGGDSTASTASALSSTSSNLEPTILAGKGTATEDVGLLPEPIVDKILHI